jgi:hypothetical protein
VHSGNRPAQYLVFITNLSWYLAFPKQPLPNDMEKTYKIGNREFPLDQDKAEAAFADKKVINGRKSMCFNLLPLKYQWAYDLYRTMKANHW